MLHNLMMSRIKNNIPNVLTATNLFLGFIAVILALKGMLASAFLFILMASLFDFLDGMAARLLRATSEYGKILDSLADMVSFGLAPACIMYQLLLQTTSLLALPMHLLAFAGGFIAVFSALRLAKFHLDTRQSDQFIGLPTPANAILMGSIAYLFANNALPFMLYAEYLLVMLVIFSYLLIAEIPLIALKFKSYKPAANIEAYTVIVGAIILFLLFQMKAIPLIIIFYIIASIFFSLLDLKTSK